MPCTVRSSKSSMRLADTTTHPRTLYALLSLSLSGVGLVGPYPAVPRPARGILAALCERTVLDVGRRAPVRPLRVGGAPRPSPRAAYSPPTRGGYVRCRALPNLLLPTRR